MATSQGTEGPFNLQHILLSFKMDFLQTMRQLETDIVGKLNITLQPFVEQMQEIKTPLQQTTQKAEMALDLMESLREENHFLRQEMAELKDNTILMEIQL